eukprot:TRINITY_DN50390_c0_g1_i1.p1 TRINITY_DN50390_c0_g1~~TRINITY_DN50390_c0_g1_i1.p1  ORF type:complete len:1352 (+),score=471.97 TRINITY_DN50390_c0_g1_i1:98-4057(+)
MATVALTVNGERVVAEGVLPHHTLAAFLRQRGLTGTKISCGQGGCGACTVVLAVPGAAEVAVNACIRPLLLCDGCSVTTTEGIGSPDAPHPVQQRIAECNGSQCGFCTPGQVMSMYALLRSNPDRPPSPEEVEKALDGNLCRCTGYRGIHAAFYKLASKDDSVTNVPGLPPPKDVPRVEPPRPAVTAAAPPPPLRIGTPDGMTQWSRVASVQEWCDVARVSPRRVTPVVGLTVNGLFGVKLGAASYCDVSRIPELLRTSDGPDGLRVGGAVTISELQRLLRAHASSSQSYGALADGYDHVANANVRNAGGWAGNLCLGRVLYFPSDGAPLLSASGAEITVARPDGSRETVSAWNLACGDFDAETPYLIVSMRLPRMQSGESAAHYTHCHLPVNAHSVVAASFRATVQDGRFNKAEAYFMGLGKLTVRATEASAWLDGKPLDEDTLSGFLSRVASLPVSSDGTDVTQFRPQGKDEQRRQLAVGFAYKWFLSLKRNGAPPLQSAARAVLPAAAQKLRSEAVLPYPAGPHPGKTYVGPKKESLEQACGVTQYAGDLSAGPRTLYGAFVTSRRVGKLVSVDPARAMAADGAVAFIGPKDVPGMNSAGLVPGEEPLFAEPGSELVYCGAPLGLVVAKSAEQALQAARQVAVKIADPEKPPIFTIAQALERKSFLNDAPPKKFAIGDCDGAFARSGAVIVEGDISISGQNNFYMEKQTAMAVPEDMGRVTIHGGCQCPDMTKSHVMVALGCSSDKITIKNRPMGGAFGGKFTKQYPAFCAAAVASKKLRRPVSVAQSIHTDMGFMGNTRHVAQVHYKAAVTPEGKLLALDTDITVDAGCGNDYSDYIADEILKRQDFAYEVANYRSQVAMVKTHNPSSTAVRAPGLMQACVISETVMDAIAAKLGLSGERVRGASLKRQAPTDMTGQHIMDWNMPRIWDQIMRESDFERREAEAERFNASNTHKKRAVSVMPLKYAVGYINMSGATVTVNVNAADGSVAVQTGCCEMGQGCLTKVLSTVATELGVSLDKVSGYYPDTSVIPNLSTDGGSAGAEMLCTAARLACIDLLAKLAPVRAQAAEEKAARKESGEPTWEEVVMRAYGPMPSDTRMLLSATAQFNAPGWHGLKHHELDAKFPGVPYWNWEPAPKDLWRYYVTGAACSEVEVDTLTGEVCILRSDVLLDAGNSISPLIDLGQAEGGFAYGIGAFLKEEVLMDPNTGRNKSDGTWEYKIPSNKCVPREFNVRLLPGNPSSQTHYGSKGAGEPPMLLAYSAVSAVRKAVAASRAERGLPAGFRLDNPATPDRVCRALELSPADLHADDFAVKGRL